MGKEIRVKYGARKDSTYAFSESYLKRLDSGYNEIKEKSDNGSGFNSKKERMGNICQTIEMLLKKIKESNSKMVEINAKFLSETVGVTEPIMRSYLFSIHSQRRRQNPLTDDAYA